MSKLFRIIAVILLLPVLILHHIRHIFVSMYMYIKHGFVLDVKKEKDSLFKTVNYTWWNSDVIKQEEKPNQQQDNE